MDTPPITYVRHAMPVVDDAVPSSRWHLDESGITAARALAKRLEVGDAIGRLASSTEPKALETAGAIAEEWHAVVVEDPRLREADRPWVGAGYRGIAHGYLRGDQPEGWEPHAEVASRMAAAVDDALADARGRPVVVVSHGLALSLHLGDRLGAAFDRESFWSGLSFPDAWVLGPNDVLHRSPSRSPIS
jgi:broad specificity phosphatase PhoE